MNNFLSWLALGGTALLLVAVSVAWFEHRRRMASRFSNPAWSDTDVDLGTLRATTALDICLDQPYSPGQVQPVAGDHHPEQSTRQGVLAATLSRMARHNDEQAERNAWVDTRPQVSHAPSNPAQARSAVE